MTTYVMVIEYPDHTDLLDAGFSEAEAYTLVNQCVETLVAQGHVVSKWQGIPVWDVQARRGGQRLTIALYEKDDDGESGGQTCPLEGLQPQAWRLFPFDHSPEYRPSEN